MIYYRDPLLDKICDRIFDLAEPAFIKNSELVYVAVNDAYAQLFNVSVSDLVGTGRGDHEDIEVVLGIEDRERACLVFGEEQVAPFSHPFGKGRFRIELERFTLADGQTFLYGVFSPQTATVADIHLAPAAVPAFAPSANVSPVFGGQLDKQQLEQLTEELDVGLCIWDKNLKLVYFNERLRSYYEGFIDPLYIGLDLRDSLSMAYDNIAKASPERLSLDAEAKQRVIDAKLETYLSERSTEYSVLPNGRWLRVINRRQPDGSVFGLRIDVTDIKSRELQLEEHIEHVSLYRELLNRLPVPAFARGADRTLTFINQAYADFFGRSSEELLGTGIEDLVGIDSAYAHRAELANINTLESGEEYSYEDDVPLADGHSARSIIKIGRLITDKGTPFLVGTLVDISPIRQRELQLKEAIKQAEAVRQDIESIISSVDIGLIVLDEQLNIQLMNRAYKRLIAGSSNADALDDMIGRPLRDLMYENYRSGRHPVSFQTFEAYYDARIASIRSGRIDPTESLQQNGVSLLYSSIPLSEGRTLLCYVDLTEIRKRDAEVADAHGEADNALQLVRTATDMMPEGLMVLQGEYIVFANGSLARLFGVPEDLVVAGARWEDLYRATIQPGRGAGAAALEESVERFRKALMSHKDVSYDFPLDGERWVHLEMRNGVNGQCVVICSDETMVVRREGDLKRLLAKAEAADRAKSEFLANMSLEIRTPMNGILGMAELLSKSHLDTRQKSFTDIIVKSGKTLLTVLNDILDISKLDAGNLELRYAPFDPGEAIEDVVSLYAFRAAEKDLELIVQQAEGVPRQVMGDAVRFRQILANLIGNAVKFTERGHVAIDVGVTDDGLGQAILGISVEDTGSGIPQDMLGKIFEIFSQADAALGHRKGTGLGLAITQRLAQLQGGTIVVHSTEGQGSTFTFTIPVQVAEQQPRSKPVPANVAKARILVAAHHEVARNHLIQQVSMLGFECVGAPDAAMSLSILDAAFESQLDVDVLLVDSQLPGLKETDMIGRIRDENRFSKLSVIMLTSRDFGSEDDLASDTDVVQAHLMKPVRAPLLKETLVEVIRATRLPRSVADTSVRGLKPISGGSPSAAEAVLPFAVHHKSGDTLQARPYVLVAEDNEVNRMFFGQILDSAGYAHTVVNNGEEALQAWHNEAPLVILMDTEMPVMDGFEATQRIRAIETMTGGHTPIIGVMARVDDSEREQCVSSGMDDHIVKPISPERLEAKIRQWIGDDLVRAGQYDRA